MSRLLALFGVLAVVAACSGGSGTGSSEQAGPDGGTAGTCSTYTVPAGTDLTTPVESFATNVMPIFHASCSLSTCHGSTSSPQGGLFLGGTDAPTVYANLVGKLSSELPTMGFVTPTDPSTSYLMHKMDADQCAFQAMCTDGDCQHLMPSDASQPLPVATRDTVRRWIAQGAKNN